MTERKITEASFEHGPLRKILDKQMHIANLSEAGRERLTAALRAGVVAEAKKHDLQFGVGDRHLEALKKFPKSEKYADRHLLKPKELKTLESSLDIFFKTKPAEPEVEKERAVPPVNMEEKVSLRVAPEFPRSAPEAANDGSPWKKAA